MYSIFCHASAMFVCTSVLLLFGLAACGQQLDGLVDECECSIEHIAQFNTFRIYPQIQAIIRKDYFRYFKVDLSRECPFWHDDSKCALKDCSVEVCDADDIPFVRAEKLRLESGSGELDDELALESSQPKAHDKANQRRIEHLPYYERAKTKRIDVSSLEAKATSPPNVEEIHASTQNVLPTATSVAKITMATTVLQPTAEANTPEKLSAINQSQAQNNNFSAGSGGTETSRLSEKSPRSHEAHDEEASCKEDNRTLGKIDVTISEESLKEFESWKKHDDTIQDFCLFDDENSTNASYVDLLLNPERFTGYAGPSANRVWKTIYDENCFKGPNGSPFELNQMCLEKRVFYRAISGLHSSINIHLCAEYYLPKMGKIVLPGEPMWGINLEEFNARFLDKHTDGAGSHRLKNLHFLYLLELRAINKASKYLSQAPFYTSRAEDTVDTRTVVDKFLDTVGKFKSHFDERRMFVGTHAESRQLKEEFKQHFRNISLIMDCVGCDKCRLWGKLQTQGLGTALKILFSPEGEIESLTRTEIVTLFNAFSRLSTSLFQLENFRKLNQLKKIATPSPFASKTEL